MRTAGAKVNARIAALDGGADDLVVKPFDRREIEARARALTRKPLVAIGGITRENCASVVAAGADSVAVIADLLNDPAASAREFLRRLSG